MSTDFSVGFLARYASGIFPGKDPAGKTGHLGGIPAGSRLALGILAGSRRDPGTHFTRVALWGLFVLYFELGAWYCNVPLHSLSRYLSVVLT